MKSLSIATRWYPLCHLDLSLKNGMIFELPKSLFVSQMAGLMGMQDLNADQMSNKFEEMLATIRQVNAQFKDAVSSYRLFCVFNGLFFINHSLEYSDTLIHSSYYLIGLG